MPGTGGLRQIETNWLISLIFGILATVCGLFLMAGYWRFSWIPAPALVQGLVLLIFGIGWSVSSTRKFFWRVITWYPKEEKDPEIARSLMRGPKIVVVGGGTGLGTILRGLKQVTANITAIVTVADDGGSSGRLRSEFGMLPPGDIRSCLIALADLEPLMERLMQYRFNGGTGLKGHSFGNLFLAAMTEITGDFEQAIRASSQVLAVRGRVLPSTLENPVLHAELVDGSKIVGESVIGHSPVAIRHLAMDPPDARPVPEALTAIGEADLIILGPGSLYTSVIPNLLVHETAEAIRASSAIKVYICNAMTQPGETIGYSAADHVQAIQDHAGEGLIDYVLINTEEISTVLLERYRLEGGAPVVADMDRVRTLGPIPLGAPIVITTDYVRHDADRLAQFMLGLIRSENRRGLRVRVAKKLLRFLRGFSGIAGVAKV